MQSKWWNVGWTWSGQKSQLHAALCLFSSCFSVHKPQARVGRSHIRAHHPGQILTIFPCDNFMWAVEAVVEQTGKFYSFLNQQYFSSEQIGKISYLIQFFRNPDFWMLPRWPWNDLHFKQSGGKRALRTLCKGFPGPTFEDLLITFSHTFHCLEFNLMGTHNEMELEIRSALQPCSQEDEKNMDLGASGNIFCHKIITETDFITKPRSGFLLSQMIELAALQKWTVPTGLVIVPSTECFVQRWW